ncbi:MAG: ferrous iron transport protein B [Actinomycetales bacterium]|nr:ferrous iron transport protein B [Actinomycetales bacterium]
MSESAPSCHSDSGGVAAPPGTPVVALAGAPNVGKSTLFNRLTGARRDVGNWPGTTVEVGRGLMDDGVHQFDVIDLPGAYSLDPLSPDEALTRALLVEVPREDRPELVVVVGDATRLSRSLYLVRQLRETDQRLVLAVTMGDIAHEHGIDIDAEELQRRLGVPVAFIDPRHRHGRVGLLAAMDAALAAEPPAAIPAPARAAGSDGLAEADARFGWIDDVVDACVSRGAPRRQRWSDRFDRLALSAVLGPITFLVAMWAVFQLTTTVAAPLQGALDWFFTGPVTSLAITVLDAVGLGGTWVQGLVVDGLISGVGMLLTFVPLMAIMFALLALLEDSGYLARAAVVTDRLMRAIGLPGRAFLPLIVGFGCNVPAIAATRILPNARHRILTALLVPFTSCSARLTVYVLVASIFFPEHAGTVVFAMYLISIVFVVVIGLLLRGTLWRTMGSEPLVIDLPPYQRPSLRLTLNVMWLRLSGFLRTASGIIVATVIVVWFLQAIPTTSGYGFGQVPVEESLYATTAQAVAPVFQPAGFGTWETTSALMVGFIAKEAVISSWAQTYSAEEPDTSTQPGTLGQYIKADFEQSSGGHTSAAVWAFLVFLLAYTPCVATLAAQRREIGARWTGFGIALQLSVAWLVAVAIFQIGSRL